MPLTPESPIERDRREARRPPGRGPDEGPAGRRRSSSDAFEIHTVRDLLHHYPRRYIDRSRVATIGALKVGQPATVIATVKKVAKRLTRRHQTMVSITLSDGTGYLELTFFNQPWIANLYKRGDRAGRERDRRRSTRASCSWRTRRSRSCAAEDVETVHTGRITPVHPASEGITTRTIRELVYPRAGAAAGRSRTRCRAELVARGGTRRLRRGDPAHPFPGGRPAARGGASSG